MPLAQGTVGPTVLQDGIIPAAGLRQGRNGELVATELHGKFYEQTYRGNVYSVGMTTTALSANTITLTATTTPIIGVWNPTGTSVNLSIIRAVAVTTVNAASAVAPGGLVWATSTGNGAITTGLTPFNRKSLVAAGSQAKGFNISTALTGLTNNLVIQFGANLPSLVAAQGATVSPLFSTPAIEEFDGSLLIPPGGVLALLNTVSTTTVSVAAQLVWEETPL